MLTEKQWLDFGIKPFYAPARITCANCEDREMEWGLVLKGGRKVVICWECGAKEDR